MSVTPESASPISEALAEPRDRALSFAEIWRLALSRWWHLVAVVALSTVSALVLVAQVPPVYVARAYIVPNLSPTVSGQIGQLQQLSGLLGGSGGGGAVAVSELAAIVRSVSTANVMVERTDLLQRLFSDRWDSSRQEWVEAPGFFASAQRLLYERVLGIDDLEPGADLLAEHVQREVTVAASKVHPGLFEITYEARDLNFARDFLTNLLTISEETLLDRYRSTNKARLDYITEQMQKQHPVEVANTIQSLAVAEMRTAVNLASGRLETVRIVLSPEVSSIPKRPSVFVTVFLFNLVGILLWLAVLVLRSPARAP
jgi:hypothetical protein